MGVSKTNDHIQIKIKMPNTSQEHPAPTNAQNPDLKDMDFLCTLKFKIESWYLEYGCIKEQWQYSNQDQDDKPQSGTSSVLWNPKSGLKGHICSLHLQNEDRHNLHNMGVSKTSDHIKIKIKMQNPHQEPPASINAQNQDLKVDHIK